MTLRQRLRAFLAGVASVFDLGATSMRTRRRRRRHGTIAEALAVDGRKVLGDMKRAAGGK